MEPIRSSAAVGSSMDNQDGRRDWARPLSLATTTREYELLHGGKTSYDMHWDKEGDGENLIKKRVDRAEKYPSGIKMFFIIIALILSIFLFALDMTIVATAIPSITHDFRGLERVGWYGAAFFMTLGGFQSTWGKIYKFFSLKWSFIVAIFIFEIGSVICGVAPKAEVLILGRAIAGIGAAGLCAGAYTIVAFTTPPNRRPAMTGLIGASYGFASVLGPLLGGLFSEKLSWRYCFYINIPIGAVSALIILFCFQTPRHAVPEQATLVEKLLHMDPLGIILVMGATISFMLAFQYGGQSYAWKSPVVIGLFSAFGGLTILWILLQRFQGDWSMIERRLIKDRTIAVMCAYAFFLGGSFFLVIYYIPIYFQSVHGTSATMSGVRNLPFIISATVSTIVSGVMISITGYYQPQLIAGAALSAVGGATLYLLDVHSPSAKWIGFQIIAGVGWGTAFQVPLIAVQGSVPSKDISSATGILLFFQGLGSAFFLSAGQSAFLNRMVGYVMTEAPRLNKYILVHTGASEIRRFFIRQQHIVIEGYMQGLKVVFAISVGAAGLAVLIGLCTKWKKLKREGVTVVVA